MEEPVYHGSCLCKGITFEIQGEPEKVFICYCRDCAKNAGAPYQVCAKFRKSQVHVEAKSDATEGTWIIQKTTSGSEKHKKFCIQCGCTLWTIPMHHGGDRFIVRAALLDSGSLEKLAPSAEFFASSKPSWVKSPDNVKAFATMPGQ
ncbi:hypothetical protein N7475_007146 [Penicillium sp. IBT 31633x]|nr:hypothetical protein N7475_007146 [Penicillium sp. IBT 31633x]